MISLDSETTGVDVHHGAKPFLVTTCNNKGTVTYWEADVDPLTREPLWHSDDLREIASVTTDNNLVLQNPKFDLAALRAMGLNHISWNLVWDTLLAGHLLASNQPHDLTTMALVYLGVNIQPLEDAVEKATNEARRLARSRFPNWLIAKKGLPCMPSAKEKTWKFDMWLPRSIAKELDYEPDHPWWTVCSEYANGDSAVTLPLFHAQKSKLEERGLWEIYLERRKVLPIAFKMEANGITLSGERMQELQTNYEEEVERSGRVCVNIAKGFNYDLDLPKSGKNKSLTEFVFNVMKLPTVKKTATGAASLDKNAVEAYQATLPDRSKELLFISTLSNMRKRATALSYMEGYRDFWLPVKVGKSGAGWYRLHPSLNPTGTDTLRWSSSNPNEQNISKKEGFNLRYMFGPAPGREWWSLDYSNLELRIPAYEAGEEEMVNLFENPNDGPYYGGQHLLTFDVLHPEKFKEHGVNVKKVFASTWYQWVKNGNFAVQYGAVEQSGTADRAYHVPGAQAKIKARFKKIAKLGDYWIEFARQNGFVETIPDKTVCPERGYPMLCTRSRWGDILPTVPLSYHVQGTAMWVTMKAMIRVQAYFDKLNAKCKINDHYRLALQVHDELVIDLPYKEDKGNLPIAKEVSRLMCLSGDDIGVPLATGIEYHVSNWSTGESCN